MKKTANMEYILRRLEDKLQISLSTAQEYMDKFGKRQ
jgi:hypothetical protein